MFFSTDDRPNPTATEIIQIIFNKIFSTMKFLLKAIPAALIAIALCITGCSKDDPENGGGGNSNNSGGYGQLNGNLITIGSTRDITYTGSVLLGTVDFLKITSDHTYGIVYMEALIDPEFNYDNKLVYGGHNDRYEKEEYECEASQITKSTTDGRFEKQLIGLKPATRYYYRAYVAIGQNINYSDVEYFTTLDPSAEITMTTSESTEIFAVAGTMNGVCNVGKLQDVNEDQKYGFIYTDESRMSSPETLSYEYYEEWVLNHFETEDDIEEPDEITTTTNLNGRINCEVKNLKPGTTYWYRTFFYWNGKYFYSPEIKSLTTKGANEITVLTENATDITSRSATLKASLPFSQIGLNSVHGGFLISKDYSNASEFDIKTAESWEERYSYPDAKVYYIGTTIHDKDFSATISGLDPETVYYVRAFVDLGEFDDEDFYIYGSMQHFTTESSASGQDAIEVTSSGSYPWTQYGNAWYSGNRGVNSSISILNIHVTHSAGQIVTFNLQVSSESSYDGVRIMAPGYESDFYSGTVNREISLRFNNSGVTDITVQYSKDSSSSAGDDQAIVSNITLQ